MRGGVGHLQGHVTQGQGSRGQFRIWTVAVAVVMCLLYIAFRLHFVSHQQKHHSSRFSTSNTMTFDPGPRACHKTTCSSTVVKFSDNFLLNGFFNEAASHFPHPNDDITGEKPNTAVSNSSPLLRQDTFWERRLFSCATLETGHFHQRKDCSRGGERERGVTELHPFPASAFDT